MPPLTTTTTPANPSCNETIKLGPDACASPEPVAAANDAQVGSAASVATRKHNQLDRLPDEIMRAILHWCFPRAGPTLHGTVRRFTPIMCVSKRLHRLTTSNDVWRPYAHVHCPRFAAAASVWLALQCSHRLQTCWHCGDTVEDTMMTETETEAHIQFLGAPLHSDCYLESPRLCLVELVERYGTGFAVQAQAPLAMVRQHATVMSYFDATFIVASDLALVRQFVTTPAPTTVHADVVSLMHTLEVASRMAAPVLVDTSPMLAKQAERESLMDIAVALPLPAACDICKAALNKPQWRRNVGLQALYYQDGSALCSTCWNRVYIRAVDSYVPDRSGWIMFGTARWTSLCDAEQALKQRKAYEAYGLVPTAYPDGLAARFKALKTQLEREHLTPTQLQDKPWIGSLLRQLASHLAMA